MPDAGDIPGIEDDPPEKEEKMCSDAGEAASKGRNAVSQALRARSLLKELLLLSGYQFDVFLNVGLCHDQSDAAVCRECQDSER